VIHNGARLAKDTLVYDVGTTPPLSVDSSDER
jgi:hypothetical protein